VRVYDAFVDALDFRLLGIDIDDRKVRNSQSILQDLSGVLAPKSSLTHRPDSPILPPTKGEFLSANRRFVTILLVKR